ncbi:MAG: NifB/NifX family molybdenum-iron cluster-binding protein [Anaerolineae bacterium]
MKVAFVTDDGETISAHFGRAAYYAIYTVEDGKVTARELVEKVSHHRGHHHEEGEHGHEHGQGGHHHDRDHSDMIAPVSDCAAVVARGMGQGALNHLLNAGIRPILTDLTTIDEALQAYIQGGLSSNVSRIHFH